ncbi:GAS2-like protein 2 [Elysia marginata]|uniref:GAS2-like protein 2 n=1 Tax=Elysia marginata TaxID=1093978 RepID=A0AAV4IJU1_9GAST|nr:GAS2-like protein 2 [Elysia marginata]
MYSVVEPLLRTASRFDAKLSDFTADGDSQGNGFTVEDHHDEKETSLDRLFAHVGSNVYRNGVKPAACDSTTPTLDPTAATKTAAFTKGITTDSVLASLPRRTMVHPARRVLEERELGGGVYRSVSFDERAEWNCDQRSSSSSLDKVYEHPGTSERPEARRGGGGVERGAKEEEDAEGKSNMSMDKISTMTLSEFRSLLNSNLSVPENHHIDTQNERSPAGSSDSGHHQANWDSLREKARSVRDSISNSVSNRRTGAGTSAVGRRSLPQSPDGSGPASSFERPKTPQALRRNRNSSSGRTSPVSRPKTPTSVSRPKTPTASVSRPKTPTSGIARPKTPTSAPREEYRMSRPKTPSQVKRDAVAKVAGAISNWVDSRPDVASYDRSPVAITRPKTPTSRPKTPTKQQIPRRWDGGDDGDADVDDDFDDDDYSAEVSEIQTTRPVPVEARERPSTPSRIPKPSFLPRPTTPKISSIPVSMDSAASSSRERPHTSLGTSSSLSLSSQEEEILQRQQQLQRLQRELEEAQIRMDEDRRKQQQQQINQPQEQHQQTHATRPNFLPTNSISRSNSNASSEAVHSPSSGVNGSGAKTKIAVSRRLPLPRGSSEDSGSVSRSYREIHTTRRCVTPGPGTGEMRAQPSRAVTPGPREKWAIGGSIGTNKTSQQRRGSLNTGAVTERNSSSLQKHLNRSNYIKNSNSALNNGEIPLTNEITFSDDEEINELVRNAALMNGAQSANQQTSDTGRVRSASVDARRLERQTVRRNSKGGEEVLMIRRDPSGGHAVEITGTASRDKPPPKGVVRRPQKSQGSSIVKPPTSSAASSARFRSQTPDPSMFRQRMTAAGQKSAVARPTTPNADTHTRVGKPLNRTEAWVDSTLSDPKRKLPTKPRRGRGAVSGEISASELVPRPLEEIQAMLSTPRDGAGATAVVDTSGLEAPPEDPEMFRKMEKLFEKYREMELRASVNETPGGPPVQGATPSKSSSEVQSSGRPGSLKSSGGAASSGKHSLSIRTSSSGSGAATSSVSQRASPMRQSSMNSNSVDVSRYGRASSAPQQREAVSAINSPSSDLREFSGDIDSRLSDSNRHRAVSQDEADQKGLQNSLRDIDPETAKNPAALITKIKEILKVRPRRDENAQIAKTRIPAPSTLTRSSRSKSVSNLFSGQGESGILSVSTRGVLNHTSHSNGSAPHRGQLNRANSGSSGNISYSEFVFNDEEESADNVPELSKAWSVKSDSSDSQTRSETPVPKLATPLTTGRSTLISRKGDRMGRSLSQDKENNLSNSQTSLSGRSTFSATEEDAEYV